MGAAPLPQPPRSDSLANMRKLLALALLLIPLQPVIAAGICVHAAELHARDCGMPAQDMPHGPDQSNHNIPPDCAGLALCASSAPVVPQAALQFADQTLPDHPEYSSPTLLFSGERIAPPQPPPIA